MKNLFDNTESPFFVFLGKMGDLLLLNVLWILFSLPIITIGASTAAMYYCTQKIRKDVVTSIFKMFWYSFIQDLRQGVVLTGILLGIGCILTGGIIAYFSMGYEMNSYIQGVLFIIAVIFLMVVSYTFPMLALFQNCIADTIKNSFLLAITNPAISLVVLIMNLLPVYLALLSPTAFVICLYVWLFLGFSVTAQVNTILLSKVFAKYADKSVLTTEKDDQF